MKILFQLVNPHTIYAGRSIYYGYKNAFEDLGHTFKSLTPGDDQKKVFSRYRPDIFMTSLSPLVLRHLDLSALKAAKKRGTKVFIATPFWKSPLSKFRINETQSLSTNKNWIDLIMSSEFGDIYHSICEQGDSRMDGFTKTTGYPVHTILLAADKTLIFPDYNKKFDADISFIGTYLPEKKKFFEEQVAPLIKRYDTKIYGQDWTTASRIMGLIQRGGQYFNIPYVRSFLKQSLELEQERQVYTSSTISINFHEKYQKNGLGDLNERTFKIPLAGGFEVVDNVPSLHKYFKDGKELVIAKNKSDWFEKIGYYTKNPEKRQVIIKAGRSKILRYHTYHLRVEQIIRLYERQSR